MSIYAGIQIEALFTLCFVEYLKNGIHFATITYIHTFLRMHYGSYVMVKYAA